MFLSLSQRKAQKALDKEIPYAKISDVQWPDFQMAIKREWDSWVQYDAAEALSAEALPRKSS